EIIPLKPELRFVAAGMRAVINAVNIKFPCAAGAIAHVLDRHAVANFPTEALRGSGSYDRAFAVGHEFLPLVIRHHQFVHHLALIFRVNHELREEVLLVLIDAAKPVIVRDGLHSRNAQDLIAVREGKRLDDRNAVDDYETVRAGDMRSAAERPLHHRQESEEKQRYCKRSHRQNRAHFLAPQIRKYQVKKFHAMLPTRPPSTSTPLLR